MGNEALFAVIAGGGFLGVFAILCIITGISEAIDDAVERRRRRKYRNNYVRFK